MNGVDDGSASGTPGNGSGTVRIGNNKGGTSTLDGNILGVYAMQRVLSPALHLKLYQDFFGPVRADLRVIGQAAAAAGGLGIPIAAYHYEHHLRG